MTTYNKSWDNYHFGFDFDKGSRPIGATLFFLYDPPQVDNYYFGLDIYNCTMIITPSGSVNWLCKT